MAKDLSASNYTFHERLFSFYRQRNFALYTICAILQPSVETNQNQIFLTYVQLQHWLAPLSNHWSI